MEPEISGKVNLQRYLKSKENDHHHHHAQNGSPRMAVEVEFMVIGCSGIERWLEG